MLLSTVQSVSAMAEFCAPNEHDRAVVLGVTLTSGADQISNVFEQNDLEQVDYGQTSPDQNQQAQSDSYSAHVDDCTSCQCCTHIALARPGIAPGFQAPYTPLIRHTSVRLTSSYLPLLRPPKV